MDSILATTEPIDDIFEIDAFVKMDINDMECIPETETKKEIIIETEEEKQKKYNLELTRKVKILGLKRMGLSIMTNTYNMSKYRRDELQQIMRTYEYKEVDEIINEFNAVINEELFDNPKIDISKLPIYDI